jgi:F-type H+-transporting ATPase subunit b
MENELLFQLGINWKLLLSQMFNFAVLFLVLTFFVYKPVIKIIKTRTEKIEEGLQKAEEANTRLKEVDKIGKFKIKEAEEKSIEIIKLTGQKAKLMEQDFQEKAEEKQKRMAIEMEKMQKKQKEQTEKIVLENAVNLVKDLLSKTVELNPKEIDDKLIKKAVDEIHN